MCSRRSSCRGDERRGEAFIGFGSDYKARFDRSGVAFTPALGRRAPHNLPLRWTSRAFQRGQHLVELGAREPSRKGDAIEFVRSACVERYEIGVDGIEQSFVFTERPDGHGDLRVTLDVETELSAVRRDGDGWVFEIEGIGGVRVGGVTGVDADGEKVSGSIQWNGSSLELSLPHEFVEHAKLPLVLDPPVSGVWPITLQS